MGYDVSANEVIVSNAGYGYSYVFNLETKTWHKISDVFGDVNRHLGLQEYRAEAVEAKAVVYVDSFVSPGRVVNFRKSATLPEMVLPMGRITVEADAAGVQLPLLEYEAENGVRLSDVVKMMKAPEKFIKFLEAESKVYTSMYTGLRVGHSELPEGLYFAFVPDVRDLMIAAEGVGEEFSVTLGGRVFSRVTEETDDSEAIAGMLAEWMREAGYGASAGQREVVVRAKPGVAGNTVALSCVSSASVRLSASGFSGGEDAGRRRRVCDIREEEEDGLLTVYLQTRPMNLDFYGFKKLRHYLLRGEFRPGGDGYHGFFMFASDDLMSWRCVSEGGFKKDLAHACMPMVFHSFRYFVMMGGGKVRPGHVFAHAEVDEEAKLNSRLR